MTKIYFERTGGFMGRKVSLDIDLEELPEDQAKSISKLLEESDFFNLSNSAPLENIPDGFTYKIKVVDGTQEHSVQYTDTTTPDDLRPLLDELGRQARMQR